MDWARQVSQRFNTQHYEITICQKEAFEFYQTMLYHHDEPLADCVSIPLYYVAKLLKEQGLGVVHVGEGADELFCGYNTYVSYLKLHNNYWHTTQKYIPAFAKRAVGTMLKPLLKQRYAKKAILN